MADNFFNQEPELQEQEVEKIKLGDDEYTQDELTKLVGLGKIGLEAEAKYHTRIDRVWPQFQQTIGEKKQLQEQLAQAQAERQVQQQQPQAPSNQPMTEVQMRDQAIKAAEDLGIGPKSIQKTVMDIIQGQQLLGDINSTIDDMTADGLPSTTTEEIIAHMQQTGIRNPQKAYKDMFEKEWVESQTTKLEQIRTKGLPTISGSTAGSKQPAPVKITSANFDELFAAAISANAE